MKVHVKVRHLSDIEIPISTEYIKLESFLKLCGVAPTGGMAKQWIQDGEVLVDGEVCLQRGKKLRPDARVTCLGQTFRVTEA